MDFAQAMKNETSKTFTENGAKARNTSNNALVDLFGVIGALRPRTESEIKTLFEEAYKEDPLMATKILFYARDIREGLGERRTFRILIKYLAQYHPEAIKPNLDLIGVFGRYDDLYELIGTPVENDMWNVMKSQFDEDIANLNKGNAVSLLAKWIKTPDASSQNTRKLGILTAKKLGYSVYDFKRMLRALRKQIDIVERYISAKEYDKIKYSEVPSRAMLIYKNLFVKNDSERYNEFISAALAGKTKINSSTLYPYDITSKYGSYLYNRNVEEDATLEAQWRQLPNYVQEGTNALVISDLSGSMMGRPMHTSIGLAIYFAERNKGAYQDMFIPFSTDSHLVKIKGDTLAQKINYVFRAGNNYCGSTNLESAFKKVLDVAIANNVPKNEMVKSLIVISDMEIDAATEDYRYSKDSWSFYENMRAMYEAAGYDIPNIIFWNVESRNDVFHADANRKGVQLVSGQSTSTFKNLIGTLNYTPAELMMKVINSPRYDVIKVA